MSAGHSHGLARAGHEKKLWIALALTTSFMIAEVIGAFITGSLALLSDAAHMLTDSTALAISLVAIQIAKRAADKKRTFGYARFEILAEALNLFCLLRWRCTSCTRHISGLRLRQKYNRQAC